MKVLKIYTPKPQLKVEFDTPKFSDPPVRKYWKTPPPWGRNIVISYLLMDLNQESHYILKIQKNWLQFFLYLTDWVMGDGGVHTVCVLQANHLSIPNGCHFNIKKYQGWYRKMYTKSHITEKVQFSDKNVVFEIQVLGR